MPSAQPRRSSPSNKGPRRPAPAPAALPEIVDPRWLLKAGAAVVAVGLLCAYLSVCALFYFQQGQFVLHPSRAVQRTPAAADLAFEPVRFAVDAAGTPQLSGWWIPGDQPSDPTALVLHAQDGSMSDALPAARLLHDARLNVLLFDYRGYGQSAGIRADETSMRADASEALKYLLNRGGRQPSSLVVYGQELGASLAVSLCAGNPQIPALILESADGDTLSRVERDARTHIIPVGLLFHNRFPLADPLHRLTTPKLMLSYTRGSAPEDALRAADPKVTVELPKDAPGAETLKVLRRFLDTYLPQPPARLQPSGR